MSHYINVGANIAGKRAETKKALKEALATDPGSVLFYTTSPLGPQTGEIRGNAIPKDLILQVCGPDPYNQRTWYASVDIRRSNGVIRVK